MSAKDDFKKGMDDVSSGFGKAADFLGSVESLLGGSESSPTTLGYGTRQAKLSSGKVATSTRHVIHWVVPEGPIIQMYINPQSITYTYAKDINAVRTRGGHVIQYFGPQLPKLRLSGTTGSSGIEGINVLYDLYRYEQLAFDPYALYMSAKNFDAIQQIGQSGFGTGSDTGDAILGGFIGTLSSATPGPPPPSLADIAFRIEMFYSGEVYKGYFTDFTITESANEMGLFNYDLNFTVTQKRGFRQNFFAWHRSANDGPSKTDPNTGIPYSFKYLSDIE